MYVQNCNNLQLLIRGSFWKVTDLDPEHSPKYFRMLLIITTTVKLCIYKLSSSTPLTQLQYILHMLTQKSVLCIYTCTNSRTVISAYTNSTTVYSTYTNSTLCVYRTLAKVRPLRKERPPPHFWLNFLYRVKVYSNERPPSRYSLVPCLV